MYYLTVYNEPMVSSRPSRRTSTSRALKRGIHKHPDGEAEGPRGQLLASGVGVPWALEAQQVLREDWGVVADVWSVTSWTELRRDALAADQQAFT